MPTLNQMRNAIDGWLADRWPTVISRQATYFGNHGRYWQGLVTHLTPPAHTNANDGSVEGNNLESHPTDHAATWADVLPEWVSELLPARIWIDAYGGPQGHGFVGGIEATHNGTLWRRTRNEGPETYRTQGWHQVPGGPPA